MFWIKTLNKLDKNLNKMFAKIGGDIGTLQGEQENIKKRINTIADKLQDDSKVSSDYLADHTNRIAELEKKVDATIEFLKSDRNDINALIQIVRKLQ